MLILVSCFLLFITSLLLVALRVFRPEARFTWLVAVGGAMLGLVSVFLWRVQLPFELVLPSWDTVQVFNTPILFRADEISFPFALCIGALTLAILLTSVTQPVFTNSLVWAGIVALGGGGLLAVTANTPLTILLVWAALDLTELIIHLSLVKGAANNEKVVISFSTRVVGMGLLLWAGILSIADTNTFNFESMPARAGIFLVLASGLRLGVLPLHLPYSPSDEQLRRGFSTALRLISAASSLILLGRVPNEILTSIVTTFLMGIAIIAALYAGWMWLRAPDELTGRPYWVLGIASLSIVSSLSGNPVGATVWGCALILVGGAMFLTSVQNNWLNRVMLVGAWSLSSLPFSLTASAWLGNLGFYLPFVIIAQVLIITGFIRHTLRPSGRDSLTDQPGWMQAVYPAGIILLILIQVLLGLIGWDSAFRIGAWLQALIASFLTLILFWATQRFRIFKPVRAHWVASTQSRITNAYQSTWGIYQLFGRLSQILTQTLEGEGGIMWTLLFLVLFVSLITQAAS